MMVNCPKCGFSQPSDQYCAKCGVDMIAFKAKVQASRSVFSGLPLQLGGLAVLLISVGFYVRHSNHERSLRLTADTPIVREADAQEAELAQAQADMNEQRRLMNETQQASEAPPSKPQSSNSQANAAASNAASNSSVSSVANSGADVGIGTTSANAGTSPTPHPASSLKQALQPAQNVRVYYIEASKPFLQDLLNEARDGGGDGTTNYGIVANLTQRLRNSRGWQSIDSGKDQVMRINQPNMFLNLTRDASSGQNVGLTIQVIPLSRDEAGTHVQVDANRTLREDSLNFALPESLTIPKGSSLLVTGVLPHRELTPAEANFYRSLNVLKSMTGDPFRSGQTDVAFIVETH